MDTTDKIEATPIDLSHTGEGSVMVYPADFDAFMVSQPEAVSTLTDHHRIIEATEQLKKMIQELFVDIAAWGSKREDVSSVHWVPRTDDALITVTAIGEDEHGALHDSMADLDLDIFQRYSQFRINFLLFRASEEDGKEAFVDKDNCHLIYNARH